MKTSNRKREGASMKKQQRILYIFPAIVLVSAFFLFPLCYLVYVSFFEWDGLGPKIFVGVKNFTYVFSDPTFRSALKTTITWIIAALMIHIPFGLLLALLLNRKPFGWKALRIMYFIPNVISTTAIAFLWYFIYHVDVGLLNNILNSIGLKKIAHAWLNEPGTALPCNLVPFSVYVGLTMIIFMTQLSTIPKELYEAAIVDGANSIQVDLKIYLPLMKSAVITNIMLNLAFCLRTFEYPFLMTGGGPANSTMNLSLYIYKEMVGANRYGISMVAGLVTVMMGFIIMIMVNILQRERREKHV